MTFSRKRLPSEPNTPLTVNNDLPLSRVNNFKYLGATLSVDLTWAKHINSICNKTRKLVGMFYRNFYKYSNQDTSLKLYKSLIRPHLEYASAVWSPHLAKDIKAIEDVQKFGLRVCTKTGIPHVITIHFCSHATSSPWLIAAPSQDSVYYLKSWQKMCLIRTLLFNSGPTL